MPAGLLGTWIVLRGLAFFSHAVGTAAFPGLVLADGLGFAAPLGAFAAAIAFSAGNCALGRRREEEADSVVAIVLVACLAAGVILASDVFGSGANVETLLFGSLLLVDGGDIALAAVAAAATLIASLAGRPSLAAARLRRRDPGAGGRSAAALDALLLGLIALASTAALSVVGALLVAALFVVPAITARLLTRRMLELAAGERRPGRRRGQRRPLALGQDRRAARGDDRLRLRRRSSPLVAAGRALARSRRAALAARRRGASPSRLLAAGCGQTGAGLGGRLEVVATTTHDRRLGPPGRGHGGRRSTRCSSPTPTRTSTSRGPATSKPRPAPGWSSPTATASTRWIDEVVSDSGSGAEVVDLGAAVPDRLPGEDERRRGLQVRPALVARPAQRRGRGAPRSSAASAPPTPPSAACSKRNAERYLARLRRLDRQIAACFAAVPARAAQAGHRPRRLRLLRPPLRDRSRRRRDPLADDPGPALGQGPRRAGADDRSGGGERDLPGELAEPEGRRGDRPPDRRLGRPHPLRRLARRGGLGRRHLPGDGGGQRRGDGRAASRTGGADAGSSP